MQKKENILLNSLKNLFNNPIIILPSAISLLIIYSLSKISSFFIETQNQYLWYSWLAFSSLLSLAVLSFSFSVQIHLAGSIINKKNKASMFEGSKFWLKNLIVMVIIILVFNIIRVFSQILAFSIGRLLMLDIKPAQLIFFLFYFLGLAGIILFLTYSSFVLIIKKKSIIDSIKNSIKITKKNYILTLSISIVVFAILSILEKIISISLITESINMLILVPYLCFLLSEIVAREK